VDGGSGSCAPIAAEVARLRHQGSQQQWWSLRAEAMAAVDEAGRLQDITIF
jgi:hypothetical protein